MTDAVDTVNLYGKFVDAKDSLTGKKEDLGCFPKMTFKQRMYGWFTCVCLGTLSPIKNLGYLLDIMAFILMIVQNRKEAVVRFAIFYSIGNCLALFSYSFFFLHQPKSSQAQRFWLDSKSNSKTWATPSGSGV
jgi:hypothetical protein